MIRVAVTDACIFIDLYDIALLPTFFSLPLEIHTSVDVFGELCQEQQKIISSFQYSGRMTVHNISGLDRLSIQDGGYPISLSEMDKTVLHIACLVEAVVLSSDGVVQAFAKRQRMECYNMLWILDKLVEEGLLAHKTAVQKLKKLATINAIYRNNPHLVNEIMMWQAKYT